MNLIPLSWIMLVLGGACWIWFAVIALRSNFARGWSKADGIITGSAIEPQFANGFYKLNIEYLYRIDGVEYAGNRVFRDEGLATYYRWIWRRVAEKYKKGEKVTVLYDPMDPGQAILERRLPVTGWLVFFCGGGFVMLGAILMLAGKGII